MVVPEQRSFEREDAIRGECRRRRAKFLLLAVLLAGCPAQYGVMRVYPGPTLPPEQVARVGGTVAFGVVTKSVLLHTIDNTRVTEGDLDVLPGEHTVSVTFDADLLAGPGAALVPQRSYAPCFVTFRAEAGHKYAANGEALRGGKWRCWVEETRTKARTAGVFRDPDAVPAESDEPPTPPPQHGPPH